MKKTMRTLKILVVLAVTGSVANAQTVSATFGSKYDAGSNTASIFTNEAKVGYDGTTTALFALGYFNDGYNVSTEAAKISDASTLTTFLGNFNVMHSDEFSKATAAGFFTPGNSSVAEQGVGKDSYIMTLGGVTAWANGGTASELSLIHISEPTRPY